MATRPILPRDEEGVEVRGQRLLVRAKLQPVRQAQLGVHYLLLKLFIIIYL